MGCKARVLVMITARPIFVASFGSHPVVTRLALNRLTRAAIQAIVAHITRGKSLPEPLLDEIAARTDGAAVRRGDDEGGHRIGRAARECRRVSPRRTAERAGDPHNAARLADGAARSPAAGEGGGPNRRRHRPQLRPPHHRRPAALPEAELADAMQRLVAAELVFRRGTPPDATYLFKHALVRDAAYESLLKARRITLHARLLDVLENDGDAAPEVKAQHAEAAGLAERALDYWEQPAPRRWHGPPTRKRCASLENGVRLCRALGGDRQWKRREQGLHLQLGQALIANQGYQAPATLRAFERAMVLADEIGDVSLQLPAAYGKWVAPISSARFGRARPALCRARRDATRDRAAPRRAAHARPGTLP